MISFEYENIELLDIEKSICYRYNMDVKNIFSISRKKEYVEPRQVFCYLSRLLTNNTLENIGIYIGIVRGHNLHHCSVLHSCNMITNLMLFDRKLRTNVDGLIYNLKIKKPKSNIVVADVKLIDTCINNTVYNH